MNAKVLELAVNVVSSEVGRHNGDVLAPCDLAGTLDGGRKRGFGRDSSPDMRSNGLKPDPKQGLPRARGTINPNPATTLV